MIVFYDSTNEKHKVYNGETKQKPWDDVSYSTGLPANFKTANTQEKIEGILNARASQFAFPPDVRAGYAAALGEDDTLIVLKGLHQYKTGTDSAHITVAWGVTIWHFNVKINGTGNLSVASATEGAKAVSSEATGWKVA